MVGGPLQPRAEQASLRCRNRPEIRVCNQPGNRSDVRSLRTRESVIALRCDEPRPEMRDGVHLQWRKGRDSNPRSVLPDTRFPGARTRPTMRPFLESWYQRGRPEAERADSNPRWLVTTLLFESSTLNRSDTSPREIVPQLVVSCQGLGCWYATKRCNSKRARKSRPHHGRLWYAWQDSNLRPLGPQPNALSPELQARVTHESIAARRLPNNQHRLSEQKRRSGRRERDSNPR